MTRNNETYDYSKTIYKGCQCKECKCSKHGEPFQAGSKEYDYSLTEYKSPSKGCACCSEHCAF